MIDDQIWCKNIHIVFRTVYDIQINIFSDVFIIERTVTIRLYKAIGGKFFLPVNRRQESAVIFCGTVDIIPHFQKHCRKTPDCLSLNPHSGIFPVSKPFDFIDIFIGKIDTACKSNIPIHHKNFTVIAVVHHHRDQWFKRIECHTGNPSLLQLFIISKRNRIDAADIIIDKAHIHSGLCLFLKNIKDRIEHISFFNDKILEEYKMFCTAQCL